MRMIHVILGIVCLILGLAELGLLFDLRFRVHDDLTEPQFFKEFWFYYLTAILTLWAGAALTDHGLNQYRNNDDSSSKKIS